MIVNKNICDGCGEHSPYFNKMTTLHEGEWLAFRLCPKCTPLFSDSFDKLPGGDPPSKQQLKKLEAIDQFFADNPKLFEEKMKNPMKDIMDVIETLDSLAPNKFKKVVVQKGPLPGIAYIPKKCPVCKSTLEKISETSKLGCPQCYEIFAKEFKEVFKASHNGGIKHKGKIPKKWAKEKEEEKASVEKAVKASEPIAFQIERLVMAMEKDIKLEKYEDAAVKRDLLKKLQEYSDIIFKLETNLQQAISKENFEKADQIKKELTAINQKRLELE